MFKKTKNQKDQKPKNPEKAKQIREAGFGLVGCAAGACAGLVVKAGIEMITPPAMEPAVEVGYKVGKWVIAGVATTMIERAVAFELTENYNEFENAVKELKSMDIEEMVAENKETISEEMTES